MASNNKFVVSLGGSLIVPEEIDTTFLQKFHRTIITQLSKNHSFFIVTGGGKLARRYQQAAKDISTLTRDDLDWLGIHATHLNAHLIRTIFRDYAHPKILTHPRVKESASEKIIVGAGWRPGWSTDYMAVQFAHRYGADTVINLSNIDYVFDKDPSQYPDARPIKQITWTDFRKIVGDTWDPGLNVPFDPIASKLAHRWSIKVVILNGHKLDNFESFLENKPFLGTTIS